MTKKCVGIANLYEKIQLQLDRDKKAAKEIFNLVTQEKATEKNLRPLVTQAALFQLIVLCIDLSKRSRAVVNQAKSKVIAKSEKARAQQMLHHWLKKNIHKYRGFLNNCADEAIAEIPTLGRSYSWVRKEITHYIKKYKPFVRSHSASRLPKK